LFGRCKIYAIVETGGKQYRVTPGKLIDVDYRDVAEGEVVELDRVLLVADGDKVTLGAPTIEGARVMAIAQGERRSGKIIVLKYKPKVRYRRKMGHRQRYTRLAIGEIVGVGPREKKPAARRPRRRKKEVKEDGA